MLQTTAPAPPNFEKVKSHQDCGTSLTTGSNIGDLANMQIQMLGFLELVNMLHGCEDLFNGVCKMTRRTARFF